MVDFIDIGIFGETESKQTYGKPLVYKRLKITKPETSYWTHFTKYQIAQFKVLAELDYQVLGERVSTEGA